MTLPHQGARKWEQGGSKITLPHQGVIGSCLHPPAQKVSEGRTENNLASPGCYWKLLAPPPMPRSWSRVDRKGRCPIRVSLEVACNPCPRKWEQGGWNIMMPNQCVIGRGAGQIENSFLPYQGILESRSRRIKNNVALSE